MKIIVFLLISFIIKAQTTNDILKKLDSVKIKMAQHNTYQLDTIPSASVKKYLDMFFAQDYWKYHDSLGTGLHWNLSISNGSRLDYEVDSAYKVPDEIVGWSLSWYYQVDTNKHSIPSQNPLTIISASVTKNDGGDPKLLFDGLAFGDVDSSYWTAEGMPQSVIFTLQSDYLVDSIAISFGKYTSGRIYTYSVYTSEDSLSWSQVLTNIQSTPEQYTGQKFTSTKAKYIKLTITACNNTNWVNVWEVKLY